MSTLDRQAATLDELFAAPRRESGRHVRQHPTRPPSYVLGVVIGLLLAMLLGVATYLLALAVLRPSPNDLPPPPVPTVPSGVIAS